MREGVPCAGGLDFRARLREWYHSPLGREFSQLERAHVEAALADQFGYFAVQVGSLGGSDDLLAASSAQLHVFLDPDTTRPLGRTGVYARLEECPLASDSIDALVLPHTLEFEPRPYHVLREAERVLIPEGRLIILGFNPWSLLGLVRGVHGFRGTAPWCGHFLSSARLRDWLKFLGFEVDRVEGFFFRLPVQHRGLLRRFALIEPIGSRWLGPLGGGYLLVAVKRVVVLTPLKGRWAGRQRLLTPGVVEPTTRGGRHG